jgi:hypothetical protein
MAAEPTTKPQAVGRRSDLPYVEGVIGFASGLGAVDNVMRECRFHDARPIVDELSLDREGFRLVRHDSALARSGDVELLRREWRPYVEELAPVIRQVMGASYVLPRTASNTGLVVRSATKIDPGQPFHYVRNKGGIEVPYPNVHLDYTEASALNLARAEHHHRGLPERRYSRLIIIQAWQAISPPPQDRPLALMDASTLEAADTFTTLPDPDPDDYSGDAIRPRYVVFNPAQRWHYFSNMVASDLVIFKGYDSANAATPPHGSFLNQAVAGAHPRESVESRFFVYYD